MRYLDNVSCLTLRNLMAWPLRASRPTTEDRRLPSVIVARINSINSVTDECSGGVVGLPLTKLN